MAYVRVFCPSCGKEEEMDLDDVFNGVRMVCTKCETFYTEKENEFDFDDFSDFNGS